MQESSTEMRIFMDESKQMATLKEFDTMNQKYNSYTILGYKIIGILFGIFTMLLAFIPVQEFCFNDIQMIITSFLLFFMIHFMYYNYWQVIGFEKQRLLIVFLHQLTVWNIVIPLLYSVCAYGISYLLVKI